MTNQIRRATSSIGANIVEGCGKDSEAELRRYPLIALGSSSELEDLLLLSRDLEYLNNEKYQMLQTELTELRKMSNPCIQKLTANRK